MFQLIVAVISIALVAALAIASLYYGGQAFQKSSLKANVTTLVNGGQQIAGAQALYKTDHSGLSTSIITGAGGLIAGEYLAAAPGVSGAATGAWTIQLGVANGTGTVDLAKIDVISDANGSTEICAEANKQAGLAANAAIPATVPTAQFGCVGSAPGSYDFAFKL